MPTYSYQILGYDVTVAVTAKDGNDAQPISYSGDNGETVRSRLGLAFGAFGHRFNPEADTPTDLDAALISTFGGIVQRLGETPSYNPEVPDGVQT